MNEVIPLSRPKKIVVIGGSAAGPKAAARARRLDEGAEITIIQKDPELSMASCGYPYYVGGVFDNRNQLLSTGAGFLRDQNWFMNSKGIKAMTRTEAVKIDRSMKLVHCVDLRDGREFSLPYDKVIIATGAHPRRLSIPGADQAMRVGICGGSLCKQVISAIPDNSLCYGKNAEPSFG